MHSSRTAGMPRYESGPRSDRYLEQSGLELGHLIRRAHGHARIRGHRRPDAADEYFLHGQRLDQFAPGTLGIQHEAVAARRDEGKVMLVEEAEHIFANVFQ